MAKIINRLHRRYLLADNTEVNFPDQGEAEIIGLVFRPEGPEAEGLEPLFCYFSDIPDYADEEGNPTVNGFARLPFAHGVKEKVGDKAAKGKVDGVSATLADKMAEITEMWGRVCEGLWRTVAEGGGERPSDIVRAFIAVKAAEGKTFTEAEAKDIVKGPLGDKIKAHPKIILAIADIRRAREAAKAAKAAEAMAEGDEGDVLAGI